MYRKDIMMFTLGAAIGSLFTYLYMNEKQQRMLEDEAEWHENLVRELQSRATMDEPKTGVCEETETDLERSNRINDELNEEFEQEKKVLIMNKDKYKKMVTNYSNPIDVPVERLRSVRTDPYVIDFEAFCEDHDHHDKITITYYQGDDTLVDEDEEIIADRDGIIGVEALNHFGEGSEDPDVVYVRNEKMAIDYEVIRQQTSYSEVVSGEYKET